MIAINSRFHWSLSANQARSAQSVLSVGCINVSARSISLFGLAFP
jgi:hypothetical protein